MLHSSHLVSNIIIMHTSEPLCYVALFLHMYVSFKSTCGHRWEQATAMGVSNFSKLLRTCQPLVSSEISPSWSIFNIKVSFYVIFLVNFFNFVSVLILMSFTSISVLSFNFSFSLFIIFVLELFQNFVSQETRLLVYHRCQCKVELGKKLWEDSSFQHHVQFLM